jgi:hypothetical protein
MIEYLSQLAEDVDAAVNGEWKPSAVFAASRRIADEMNRLDARDFTPATRADFARIKGILDRWGTNIRGINYEPIWKEIKPLIPTVIAGYAGEGSRGDPKNLLASTTAISTHTVPPELTNSLARFQSDYPDPSRVAFIMMQFGKTRMHMEITQAIRDTLASYGIAGLRADDKEYHEDLFPNVQTYIHGCNFGVAVFERLQGDEFNPNVALEVGYMRALRKPLCLLRDSTVKTLPTDLVGKLYKTFDTQNAATSIPQVLTKWMEDHDMVKA